MPADERLSTPHGAGGVRSVLLRKLSSAVNWTAQLGKLVRWAGSQRGE